MDQEPRAEQLQNAEVARLAKEIAEREKLLKEAKTRMHWSDWTCTAIGLMFIGFAYWLLGDIKSYRTYDMQQLTPTHLLSPAFYFTLGVGSLYQTFISAVQRRTETLAKLVQLLNRSAKG